MARRFTLHGAGEDDTAQIRNLLRQSTDAIRSGWNLYAGEDTDLLIVDVDTVYGHMDWLRMLGLGIPVAALTRHTRFEDCDLILHKPVVMQNLVELLERAAEATRDRPEPATIRAMRQPLRAVKPLPRKAELTTETATTVPPAAPAEAPQPSPDEPPQQSRGLLQWIAQDDLQGQLKLQLDNAPVLLLDIGEKQFYTDAGLRALAPYSTASISAAQWETLDLDRSAQARTGLKAYSMTRLIWLCHALGSNGHPADGLDVNARYKLARWPQIEREFPKHFRIATEMMKQPATLTEIAERSGAALGEVIDFTNAYNAIGYLEIQAAPPPDKSGEDSERGAIFSRLRKSLSARPTS